MWFLPERQLVAELSVGLARRLNSILSSKNDGKWMTQEGYVHHLYTSDFENGCNVLWRLDVARAACGCEEDRKELSFGTVVEEKIWPPYFRFYSEAAIRKRLAAEIPSTAPPLDEILPAYLSVACDYGPSGSSLSSRREPFIPQREYLNEINLLAHCGYMGHLGEGVLWTDQIGPAMQSAYLWERDNQSSETVAEAKLKKECLAALELTPEPTKRALAKEALRLSELDFAILLRDKFDGLYWGKNPDGTPRPDPGDIRFLKVMYKSLRSFGQ